ncbi:MAG: universal stress protein [Actinomycetota bacterium]|nr:universal stress protein [Actinomycetota bacterium]
MTETQPTARVLAALERGTAAPEVLGIAIRVGEMTGAAVEAVHAGTSAPATLATLAGRVGVPLRQVAGPAGRALVSELERPEVRAIVMGAGRGGHGALGVGATTLDVTERSAKPVVVVPATGHLAEGPLHRLLVPLEGEEASSRPVLEALLPLLAQEVEVEVLHVFTDETLPRMLDRPVRDTELLGREFLAKNFPVATQILLRSGTVADRVVEVGTERGADMIVLSWSQDPSEGRARVVRDVLRGAALPVLLLPAAGSGRTTLHGQAPDAAG